MLLERIHLHQDVHIDSGTAHSFAVRIVYREHLLVAQGTPHFLDEWHDLTIEQLVLVQAYRNEAGQNPEWGHGVYADARKVASHIRRRLNRWNEIRGQCSGRPLAFVVEEMKEKLSLSQGCLTQHDPQMLV